MRNFSWIVFLFILLSSTCFANVFNSPKNLSYIIPKLPELKNIKCNFRQEKIMPNNVILKSSGKFIFDKEKGVTFYTTYPIKSENSYSTDDFGQINKIINAISNKDYSKIEKQFDFFFEDKENWDFGLIPKQNTKTAKYLKSIELEGKDKISKMIIITTNSVTTKIWFYD